MANQLIPALPRATDANGDPVSGAKALFYQTGTTTPVTTYTDEALSVAHSSPVVADAGGKFAQVFIGAGTQVKVVVNDADDALLYQYDPCPMVQGTSSAAESVTFNPVTGVASDNVQDAIEEVQSNITAVSANVQTIVQTGGSGGAYTLSAAETITSYATGQRFLIRPNHANTGAATLNVDGLGAKDIKVYNAAGSLVDPAAGDLGANRPCEVTYDGTRFILVSTTTTYIDERAKLTLGTKQATTSGTFFDFSVPSGAKEINVMLNEVSLSGTDHLLVQIGDSGGVETTGYSASSFRDAASAGSTSGFIIVRAAAGTTSSGVMVLRLMEASTFTWVESHGVGASGGAMAVGGGVKALSAELTTVRITRSGTDTFDAGAVNISYR